MRVDYVMTGALSVAVFNERLLCETMTTGVVTLINDVPT